jgi:hypothetical protein
MARVFSHYRIEARSACAAVSEEAKNMGARGYFKAMLAALFLVACAGQSCEAQSGGGAGASQLAWTSYTDPLEKAFSVEVPKGWRVRGGMLRAGMSDARVMVDMTSPDGTINVRYGDAAAAPYFLPNQAHKEGQTLDLGAQAKVRVERYFSGQEFAEIYGYARFAPVCKDLSVPKATERAVEQGGALPLTRLTPGEISEGEITFRCEGDGEARLAYAHARTLSAQQMLWGATLLTSYVAPDKRVEVARAVVERATKSFQLQTEWVERQTQLDQQAMVYQRARLSRQVPDFGDGRKRLEQRMDQRRAELSAYEHGRLGSLEGSDTFVDAVAGITPALDPMGREVEEAKESGRIYCQCGENRIVNADAGGGSKWEQLKPAPEN